MKYRSVYWEDASKDNSYLRMGGYEDMPTLTPRWNTTTTSDTYGKGPGWKLLGDAKMLQRMQKDKLIALAKESNPPIQVDASIQGTANTMPGGVTRFSAMVPNGGVRPAYQVKPDLKAIEYIIEKTQASIKRKSFSDLFLMMIDAEARGRPVTATEIMEKQAEKLSILGPVLERLESELLNRLIDRTYKIMERNGLIPEPPAEIEGKEIKVQYISILALAQQMQGTTAMQQLLQYAGQLGQAQAMGLQGADVMDNINFDESVQEYAKMLGITKKTMNSEETKMKIRKARTEAQQAQAQAQQAEASTKAMQQGAKAAESLGNTPVGANSALDSLMSSITGGQ